MVYNEIRAPRRILKLSFAVGAGGLRDCETRELPVGLAGRRRGLGSHCCASLAARFRPLVLIIIIIAIVVPSSPPLPSPFFLLRPVCLSFWSSSRLFLDIHTEPKTRRVFRDVYKRLKRLKHNALMRPRSSVRVSVFPNKSWHDSCQGPNQLMNATFM